MRRWNGWGDAAIDFAIPEAATAVLHERLGPGFHPPDAEFEAVLETVPGSRLPPHLLVTTAASDRLMHARGQSLPDWVALRSGRISAFPDGVAYPDSEEQIAQLLEWAQDMQAAVIPYGGGTSVVGHINPLPDGRPALTMDLRRMDRLLDLDERSRLASLHAGVQGPTLEKQLHHHGFTLGHTPQSFEFSTLGGWIATRSSGQQSAGYGRMDDLFAGGRVITPRGILDLGSLPASAAGPDLRQLVLGSEGRLGIITRASVRLQPLPETESFGGAFLPSWPDGVAALRLMAQRRIPVSMLRLSDPTETQITLLLSGRERLAHLGDCLLRILGYGETRCLLVFGLSGSKAKVRFASGELSSVLRTHRGIRAGGPVGETWRQTRFKTPYLRNSLWDMGYALDTLETAVPWARLEALTTGLVETLQNGLADQDERVLAFAHLSHVYPDGASIYVTYIFRRAVHPAATVERWRKLKSAASLIILAHQGTISHHHGVGLDHAAYLPQEKGELGMRMLKGAIRSLDPHGLMNPGKLFTHE